MMHATAPSIPRGWLGRRSALALAALLLAASAAADEVTRVYWTEWQSYNQERSRVARAAADGSGVETLLDGLTGGAGAGDLAIDSAAQALYLANPADDLLERVNLDGSGRQTVLAGVNPAGLALDLAGGKIYWTESVHTDPRVCRADLDGSDAEDLFVLSDGCDPQGIVVDADADVFFWAERMDQQIWRATAAGATCILQCYHGIGHPRGLALSADRIYWSTGEAIMSATRLGDDVQAVIDDLPDAPRHIERDPGTGRIYWVSGDDYDGLVQRVDADGTGLVTLVEDLRYGNGFALEFGEPVAAPDTPWAELAVGSHPNPFNPQTTVTFTIPTAGAIRLDVFDARGRHVRTLADGVHAAGSRQVSWRGRDVAGRDVASGVYLLRLQSSGRTTMARAVLAR